MNFTVSPAAEHRHRLLAGLANAVASRGYAETTIADVVREAGVSRRTFYEHFAGKPEAFISLYEAASHGGLRVLQEAIDVRRDWQAQIEQAMDAYFQALLQNPVLLRTLFIEILGLGAAGLQARRRVNVEIADFMLEVVNRRRSPPLLDRDMAMAVVGGVHELALQLIEQDRVDELPALAARTCRLLRAVVQGA